MSNNMGGGAGGGSGIGVLNSAHISSSFINLNAWGPVESTLSVKSLNADSQLKINGIDLIEWINLVNGLIGLPTRDIEMETKYPRLVELWHESVKESIKNMKHMVSESSLEYTKKLDEYRTFEILKKE